MISIKVDATQLPAFIQMMSEYPAMTDENIMECMGKFLYDVAAKAKMAAPVDTGRLRSDIFIDMDQKGNELKGYIFNKGVKYAPYVHDGTRYMKARPYIREAIFNMKVALQKELEKNVLKNKKGFGSFKNWSQWKASTKKQ